MNKKHRQHPLAIVIGVTKELKGYLLPLIIFFFLRSLGETSGSFFDRTFVLFLFVTIVFSLVFGFLRWFFFRFSYTSTAIEIYSGVFIKKHRTIKRTRIHTINLEANVVWQSMHLVALKIETPGNLDEAEVTISAVSKTLALDMKNTLGNDHKEDQASPDEQHAMHLNTKTLLTAGATSGSVGIIFAVVFALIAQLMMFIPSQVIEFVSRFFTQTDLVILLSLFVVGIFLSWSISIVRYTLQYAYFALRDTTDSLEIKRGLFVRRHLTIKKRRIQAVLIIEGLLRQPFKYATIQLVVAGGASESSQNVVIHPLIKRTHIDDFVNHYLSDYEIIQAFKPSPKSARKRYLIRSGFIGALPFSFMVIRVEFLYVALPIFALSLWLGYMRHRDAGYAVTDKAFALRFRRVARTHVHIPKQRIQSYHYQANPMQRLKQLRTLSASVMAAPSSIDFHVKDLALDDALLVHRWLSKQHN